MKKVFSSPNPYLDSETRMWVACSLAEMEGVSGAECGMGTPQNVSLLREEGYELPEEEINTLACMPLTARHLIVAVHLVAEV